MIREADVDGDGQVNYEGSGSEVFFLNHFNRNCFKLLHLMLKFICEIPVLLKVGLFTLFIIIINTVEMVYGFSHCIQAAYVAF